MTKPLHIEIARKVDSTLKRNEIFELAKSAVDRFENPVRDFCLHDSANLHLIAHVDSVKFCMGVETLKTCQSDSERIPWERKCHNFLSTFSATTHSKRIYHFFKLSEEGEYEENLEGETPGLHSSVKTSRHFLLPSKEFYQEWDSLAVDPGVKSNLVDYIRMIYSTYESTQQGFSEPSSSIWSKIILMHGPPGTGKTTLCKAFANKATIRLGKFFYYGQLVEINSQHLFSKYFSESGKLIERMFSKIRDLLEDPKSIVFLHIDEVENLACDRTSVCPNRDGDTLRAVNCLLAQLDNIKSFRNLVILTTSNLVSLIDVAFVDRADLKLFIGNPAAELIYEIYAGSLNELIRVGFIHAEEEDENDTVHLMPQSITNIDRFDQNYDLAQKLFKIAKSSVDLSGRTLKRIPFLTHCNHIKSSDGRCTLLEFLEAMHLTVRTEKNEVDIRDVKFFIPCPNQYLPKNFPWMRNRQSPNTNQSDSMDQEVSTGQILIQIEGPQLPSTSNSNSSSSSTLEVAEVSCLPPSKTVETGSEKPGERNPSPNPNPNQSPTRSRSPTPELKSPTTVSTLSDSDFGPASNRNPDSNGDLDENEDADADVDMTIEDPLSVDTNEINKEIPGLELTCARESTPESDPNTPPMFYDESDESIGKLDYNPAPPEENPINEQSTETKSESAPSEFISKLGPNPRVKTKSKPFSKSNVSSSSSVASSFTSRSDSSSTYSLKIHEDKPKPKPKQKRRRPAGGNGRGRGRPRKRGGGRNQSQNQNQTIIENPKPRNQTERKQNSLPPKTKRAVEKIKTRQIQKKTKKNSESSLVEESGRRRSSRLSVQSSKEKNADEKVEMDEKYFRKKDLNPEVEVRESEIPDAGRGLFAQRDFQVGEFLTEYGGQLMTRKDGIEREREYELAEKSLYLFFFAHDGKNYCIDAMDSGSLGRFVNHSKARQNARVKRVTVLGKPKLYFEASKPIKKSQEILYDYGVTRREVLKQLPWLKF